MTSYDKEGHFCVKCGEQSSKRNLLSLVRAPKGKRKKSTRKIYWIIWKTKTRGTNKNPQAWYPLEV